MKFTKYNNPNKKKRTTKKSYTDRTINAAKEILQDKKLGYNVTPEFYEKKHNIE